MSKNTTPMKSVEEVKKERTLSIAFGEGMKLGAAGLAAGSAASLYGTYRVPNFNKAMSISAKTSIPMMLVSILVLYAFFRVTLFCSSVWFGL